MEGKLSTEDDDSSSNPTRRRVLKASAALSATGVVGSGFVGSASASHEPCDRSIQCNASITFNQGTVGDGCGAGTVNDSVTIDRAEITCPNGGWIDLHDKAVRTGPSGTYKAGYPVGMSTIFQQGTYRDICIELFQNSEDVPNKDTCLVDWNRNEWPNNENPSACRSMGAMIHLDDTSSGSITHYCDHGGPGTVPDHAYLCDTDGDGDLEPINDVTEVCGDGTG